jgi:hypothetical protein
VRVIDNFPSQLKHAFAFIYKNLARRGNSMINRRTLIPTIFAVALIALSLPALAAAQGSYDPYGGYGRDNRDNSRDDRRNNDRYDQRRVRDSVKRLKDLSGDFKRHLDSALDHSRYDDSNREDRINDVARDFHDAADTLKDRADDGRNLNRSSGEARRVLQLGSRLNSFMERNQLDGRVESEWSRIRQELRLIADAYGFNWSDFDDRYYQNDNRRDNDDNRRRSNNRRNNYPW